MTGSCATSARESSTTLSVEPQVGAERARVTVSGEAQQILPFLPIPRVSETVEGPVERYVQDTGATP